MAGKHRAPPDIAALLTARLLIRLTPELKEQLTQAAARHRHSLNEEVVLRLMRSVYPHLRYDSDVWNALRKMEPKITDKRTQREIALDIARVRGEELPDENEPDNFEDIKIEWLPGSEGVLYNPTT